MKKTALVLVFVALIILEIYVLSGGSTVALEHATLSRLKFTAETDKGYVHLQYKKINQKYEIANVFLDLDHSGTYAPYQTTEGKTQNEHLVINFPAAMTKGETTGFPIMIPDRTLSSDRQIKGVAVFSEHPLATVDPENEPKETEAIEFTVSAIETMDFSEFMTVGLNDDKRRGLGSMPSLASFVIPVAYAHGDGDSHAEERPSEYHAKQQGLEDNNQQYNECAPTAVANNVRWLAQKYKFEHKIPEDFRELVDELKADLNWNNGVMDPDFVPGKNEFMTRRSIPIETHIIGEKHDPDMHWKIYQEMLKGQAVEIGVSFFTKNGDGSVSPSGGHTVAVSSVFRVEGKTYIGINDSATKSTETTPEAEIYEMTGATINAYGGTDEFAVIDYAWGQSPIKEVVDHAYVDPLRNEQNFVLKPGEVLQPGGTIVSKATSRFGFFNALIDHPGDHMVGDTFTVVASVAKRDIEQEMPYWQGDTRSIYKHGAGSPWSLRGSFYGEGAVSPAVHRDRPPQIETSDQRYRVWAEFTCAKPGVATVSYEAQLAWPRTGGEPPAELLPRYELQLRTNQIVTIESAPFFCKSPYVEPKKESPRTSVKTTCPGITEDPNGTEVEVLQMDGTCWPKAQFRVAHPDKCKGDHYHGGPVSSLDGKTKNDPNSSGCGYGEVKDVPVLKIKINKDQAAPFVGALMDR